MFNEYYKCETDMNSDNSACFGDCPKPKKSKTSGKEERVPLSNWAHLPSIVIHEIFDLLDSNKDRQNASIVCRNWRQNLFHPKWWPRVTFKIEPCNIERAKFFTSVFGKIVTSATIKVNTLTPECTDEFIILIEALSENNNLKELVIEPSHCHFVMSQRYNRYSHISNVIETLKRCLPNLTKFSIGCLEEFAHYLDEYLMILAASKQAEKITHLGLASVKDNPNEYEACFFEYELIKPFTNLKVLTIDFDQLSDQFLKSLENSNQLERLIIHLHGVRDGHPDTTNAAWREFKDKHPKCELRLSVIHSYDEIGSLHETVLREQMPLSHLKVFFCENINMAMLEFMSEYYAETLRSVIWVDSLSNTKQSWSFMTTQYDDRPDPLIMMSWLCKKLEELVIYGYKYCEENLIAIARLRGDQLKRLEVVEDDMLYLCNGFLFRENFLVDIPQHLKRPWKPMPSESLHPVLCNPTAGDSDEYLLPLVLADLH